MRNNQRSFVKLTMPADSTVWSAEVAGRPVRPGMAEQNAVLLPLEKGRRGEEAPIFVATLTYLQSVAPWTAKGRAQISLPAVDLPVSRTGLQLHYSPRYVVEPLPGSFRVEQDPGPFATVLLVPSSPPPPPALAATARDSRDASGLQALVDRFRSEPGGRAAIGALPIHVQLPTFGPSIFLASELTAEASAPALEVNFRRVRD